MSGEDFFLCYFSYVIFSMLWERDAYPRHGDNQLIKSSISYLQEQIGLRENTHFLTNTPHVRRA